jgi:parallel beta-helix repeat protein
MHGLRDRRSPGPARRRRLFFEPLEDRSLLAAIITVNSVLDTNARDDALTLREAIMINNRTLPVASLSAAEQSLVSGTPQSTNADTISFNIPGDGLQQINLSSALPEITDSVIIDGYTQPGSAQNTDPNGFNGTLLVELNSTNAGGQYGLRLRASSSTITGLIVNNSQGVGIQIYNSSNNTIVGNFVGTDATGTQSQPNLIGVAVLANSTLAVTNNVIGGSSPSARNVISGNSLYGISVLGVLDTNKVQGTRIQGNMIGTNAYGNFPLANGTGISVVSNTTTTLIGGSAPGEGNVISANATNGIALGGAQNTICSGSAINGSPSSGNVIQGNRIGTDLSGTLQLGNGADGISVGFDANSTHTIGGTDDGAGNIIAFNGLHGIGLLQSHTSVLSNSIFSNNQLGIHLGFGCTPTTNDHR